MSDICVRPYLNGEELWVAEAHRRIYAEEYQWGPEFSDYAAKVALDFASKPKSPREELWVAESKGDLIGSIMLCQTEDISTGQIRLFLVEQAYRRLCGAFSAKASQKASMFSAYPTGRPSWGRQRKSTGRSSA